MPFDKLSLKELKELAKQHKDVVKGYTSMGKEDLVKALKKHLKMDKKGGVTKKKVATEKKKVETTEKKEVLKKIERNIQPLVAMKYKPYVQDSTTASKALSEEEMEFAYSAFDLLTPVIREQYGAAPMETMLFKGFIASQLKKAKEPKAEPAGEGIKEKPSLEEIKKRLLSKVDKLSGGQLPSSFTDKLQDLEIAPPAKEEEPKEEIVGKGVEEEEKVDWEDMKMGSFTEQLQQYNRTHKKQMKSLKELADHVRADPSKFKPKTKKRADFYINVISKKKSK